MNLKDLTGWGIYSDQRTQEYRGRFIFTTMYSDNCGIDYYMYFTSVRRHCGDIGYCWKVKNPRGRRIDTKLFLTRDGAIERAKSVIDEQIN